MNHIFLYGPPGSGKSSVGELLAKNLKLEFINLDTELEEFTGMPISEIIREKGEIGFREIERAVFIRTIKGSLKVISLGGGALLQPENRSMAKASGSVIFLETELSTLIKRLNEDNIVRPLLNGNLIQKLESLLEERAAHYDSFKSRVDTTNKTPAQVSKSIQQTLGRFHVSGMGSGYDILFESNGFENLVDILRGKGLKPPVALVCDEIVAPLYAETLLNQFHNASDRFNESVLITIPAGEKQKNLDSVTIFWRKFLEAGLDRGSTVLALGGGVIGDLAGFAAATFMRGISWVNLPTTLLAMVDASIGGKTGFDLPEGKNLIGSFHPPKLVLVYPSTLETLPENELRSGLAEVVKHGVIADPELFTLCSDGLEKVMGNLNDIVRRAMRVKVDIIEKDPYEKGLRAALNLGHTVGHAVELVSKFKLRHGEAISIGMVTEARLAEHLTVADKGLAERVEKTLLGLGLPTDIPKNLAKDDLIRAMKVDKKKAANVVRFALPVKIGEVKLGVEVENLEMVFEV